MNGGKRQYVSSFPARKTLTTSITTIGRLFLPVSRYVIAMVRIIMAHARALPNLKLRAIAPELPSLSTSVSEECSLYIAPSGGQ